MDPLTQTVALLQPRGLLWKQMDATGDWAVRFPAADGVVFCLVGQGGCVFQTATAAPRRLSEGDFLLMTRPSEWTLGRDEGSAPSEFHEVYAGPGAQTTYLGDGRGGQATRIFGGRFGFEDANAGLLEGLLPALVIVSSSDDSAVRLRRVLDLLGDEASSDRPGRSIVVERLLELMLIEAIRHTSSPSEDDRRSLLAGLADPQIAMALAALHAEVQRSWTVEQLASVAGMSRSAFAERFSRILGLPPIDYLLRWRMALAKDALRRGRGRLAEVAFSCGYQSVSAFSTAFTRTVGCPPSQYAVRD